MARLNANETGRQSLALVCAGGTGGHLFPAQALAEELGRRGYVVHLATDKRGGGLKGSFPAEGVHVLPAATILSRSPLALIRTLSLLSAGFLKAVGLIRRLKPDVVAGFGGYPTLPPLMAASCLQVPSILHEQNAVMGRANRLLSRFANLVAVSFEDVERVPESAAPRLRHTGIPVRGAVVEAAETPYAAPGANQPFNLLVFGGSQGARAFAELVPPAVAGLDAELRHRLKVCQQARPEDVERVRAAYAKAGVAAEVAAFYGDLPVRMAEAHLVISRSGASTVAEVTVIGRPAILVPLPGAIDNDQLMNARALERAGAACLMPQSALTPQVLATRIAELMGDNAGLERLAAKAKALGREDAVARLADLVEELGGARNANTERAQ